jgi:hypothetical protein
MRRPELAERDVVVAAALGLGLAVRLLDLIRCRSLNLDEARLAINIASRSFAGLLAPLDLDQSAPPLFLWGEHAMVRLFGTGDCALRLLPGIAGLAAMLAAWPLARRFLAPAEARLATLVLVLSPFLINYAASVKQYSFELAFAVGFILLAEPLFRAPARHRLLLVLAAGVAGPWVSLSSVFVLAAGWLAWAEEARRREPGLRRFLVAAALLWGASAGAAFATVYRAAGANPYMQRFWELAFLSPARPHLEARAWRTVEDIVWALAAGDPLVARAPYQPWVAIATALSVAAVIAGVVRISRRRDPAVAWWLVGPFVLALLASAAGRFPIAPRLVLFALPGLALLGAAGVGAAVSRLPARRRPLVWLAATVLVILPLEFASIVRSLALEGPGQFERLVRAFRERSRPGEPIYVFARSLPAWIWYTTDWATPDPARLHYLTALARAGGAGFENTQSRHVVGEEETRMLSWRQDGREELLGLPSGMEWREVQGHIRPAPDHGWVDTEAARIERAARPGVWVLATTYYAAETALFRRLERDAVRRTDAEIRPGSALVRYEFGRRESARIP